MSRLGEHRAKKKVPSNLDANRSPEVSSDETNTTKEIAFHQDSHVAERGYFGADRIQNSVEQSRNKCCAELSPPFSHNLKNIATEHKLFGNNHQDRESQRTGTGSVEWDNISG